MIKEFNPSKKIKSNLKIKEIMYLSTCNRVEFIMNTNQKIDQLFLESLVSMFVPSNQIALIISNIEIFTEKTAEDHTILTCQIFFHQEKN